MPRAVDAAPRLADRSAPAKRRPIWSRARGDVGRGHPVAVWCLPSTLSSSGRPKRTAIWLPSVTASRRPGRPRRGAPSVMPWASRTSPTVSPKARHLLGLAVEREGHGLAHRGVADAGAGDGQHDRADEADRGRRLCSGESSVTVLLTRTILRTSCFPGLGATALARGTGPARWHGASADHRRPPEARDGSSAPAEIIPLPANRHKTITEVAACQPNVLVRDTCTDVTGVCRGPDTRTRSVVPPDGPPRLPGPPKAASVLASTAAQSSARSSPRTSAIARTVSGTRYDALGRPRYGVGVRYGASVSTRTRSSGATAQRVAQRLGVLEGHRAGEGQAGAAVQAGPGEVGVAGEAVHHPALRARPPRRGPAARRRGRRGRG